MGDDTPRCASRLTLHIQASRVDHPTGTEQAYCRHISGIERAALVMLRPRKERLCHSHQADPATGLIQS